MKNSNLITAYLDECAKRLALMRSYNLADLEAYGDLIRDDEAGRLYHACIDDGWTVAELDDAYARRFGYRMQR